MASDPPEKEIAYEPKREFVESTNVWQSMQAYDIEDLPARSRCYRTSSQ